MIPYLAWLKKPKKKKSHFNRNGFSNQLFFKKLDLIISKTNYRKNGN
jgi:hypothetical protein